MKPCECCSHPLEHVIRQALNIYENDLIPVRALNAIDALREGLAAWEARDA